MRNANYVTTGGYRESLNRRDVLNVGFTSNHAIELQSAREFTNAAPMTLYDTGEDVSQENT
jgi:hypothetical protein